ncbi:hypothetical protein GCM10007301_38130 [Azorhizobium oxalatiphilum]|uniref:Uncharacterized protein n=1 Tax=Azorhizobium oxalatiphilum TaxID=980631 RepID=A0A917C6M1_9HYPH|nr:hypothetical protein [Azorhizobium oxalatiphilum]GGF74644.1 hypothetical protein GCM10007301_38130 [Azorhizobium oxalatiphilum]
MTIAPRSDASDAELARQFIDGEEFLEILMMLGIECTCDDDRTWIQVGDLAYFPGTGYIVRAEKVRGIDGMLQLLGRSRSELPPEPVFKPTAWGPFGDPVSK